MFYLIDPYTQFAIPQQQPLAPNPNQQGGPVYFVVQNTTNVQQPHPMYAPIAPAATKMATPAPPSSSAPPPHTPMVWGGLAVNNNQSLQQPQQQQQQYLVAAQELPFSAFPLTLSTTPVDNVLRRQSDSYLEIQTPTSSFTTGGNYSQQMVHHHPAAPTQSPPPPSTNTTNIGLTCYACRGVGHKATQCPYNPRPVLSYQSHEDVLVTCAIHGKSRTSKNMFFNNQIGVWQCFPETQCKNLLADD